MRCKIELDEELYQSVVAQAEADLRPLDLEIVFLLRWALGQLGKQPKQEG